MEGDGLPSYEESLVALSQMMDLLAPEDGKRLMDGLTDAVIARVDTLGADDELNSILALIEAQSLTGTLGGAQESEDDPRGEEGE